MTVTTKPREFVVDEKSDQAFFDLFMRVAKALADCANLPDGVLSPAQRDRLVTAIQHVREANDQGTTDLRDSAFLDALDAAETILAAVPRRH